MDKITLGLEGGVAESRGPREGPAWEGGAEWRERASRGKVAAAEAWEPHGHGGFKLLRLAAVVYWCSILGEGRSLRPSFSPHNPKLTKYLPFGPGLMSKAFVFWPKWSSRQKKIDTNILTSYNKLHRSVPLQLQKKTAVELVITLTADQRVQRQF